MKKTISTVAVVAISMAVSAAAAGASQDRIPELQRPGAMNAPSITLTGCVARGTANDSYTLAEENKARAAAPEAAKASMLVALSGTEVDMSKHVGHKVAITGSYTPTDGIAGTTGSEKPAASATLDNSTKSAKTFTVKSLKMVAASCETASE
jgi:hypothetical protein